MRRHQPQTDPTSMTVRDVAEYLNVCMKVAYTLVRTPGFPLLRITPKAYRIRREAFLRWLEEEPATKRLIAARAIEAARTHLPDPPRVWEKAGNGTTPRAIARDSRRD